MDRKREEALAAAKLNRTLARSTLAAGYLGLAIGLVVGFVSLWLHPVGRYALMCFGAGIFGVVGSRLTVRQAEKLESEAQNGD